MVKDNIFLYQPLQLREPSVNMINEWLDTNYHPILGYLKNVSLSEYLGMINYKKVRSSKLNCFRSPKSQKYYVSGPGTIKMILWIDTTNGDVILSKELIHM